MQEALTDEIAAINSIYGDGTLQPSSPSNSNSTNSSSALSYILQTPSHGVSLNLEFPPNYPLAPPLIPGIYSSGPAEKKDTAAQTLRQYQDSISRVFRPGEVCLYDVIEDAIITNPTTSSPIPQTLELADQEKPSNAHSEAEGDTDQKSASQWTPPKWTISQPRTEQKSTFTAYCTSINSIDQAIPFRQHLLDNDRKIARATHNISAWRIRNRAPAKAGVEEMVVEEGSDDDGETAAGSRLLTLMRRMELFDVLVVVSRWYGGQKMGAARFRCFNEVAIDAFMKAGLVPGRGGGGGGGG